MSEFGYRPENKHQEEIAYEQARIKHIREILEYARTLVITDAFRDDLIATLDKEIIERNIRIEKLGGEIEE